MAVAVPSDASTTHDQKNVRRTQYGKRRPSSRRAMRSASVNGCSTVGGGARFAVVVVVAIDAVAVVAVVAVVIAVVVAVVGDDVEFVVIVVEFADALGSVGVVADDDALKSRKRPAKALQRLCVIVLNTCAPVEPMK